MVKGLEIVLFVQGTLFTLRPSVLLHMQLY